MAENEKTSVIVIDGLTLKNSNPDKIDIEIEKATIEKIQKVENGEISVTYEVYDESKNKIGTVRNGKLEYDSFYNEILKEKFGEYYDKVSLDSQTIDMNVEEIIDNQLRKDYEKAKMQKESIKNKNINVLSFDENKEIKSLEENDRIQEKNNYNKSKENMQQNIENKTLNNDKEKTYSEKELKQYNYATIKDREFAKNFLNTNEFDSFTLKIVMKDGKPMVLAKRIGSDEYTQIEAYEEKNRPLGEMDNIENGKENEVGRGYELTFKNKFGKYQTLDVKSERGQISVSDVSNDLDGDDTKEGVRIETETYFARPQAQKMLDQYASSNRYTILDEQEKEENNIESDEKAENMQIEYTAGSLSNNQIKEILDEREISEEVRREVIDEVNAFTSQSNGKNPTLEELNQIIGKCLEEKVNENERDEDYYTYTERNRRPPVY